MSAVAAQDDDPGDEEEDQVEDGGAGVYPGDPLGRGRGDDRGEKRQADRQQVAVPCVVDVGVVDYLLEGEDHGSASVGHGGGARHLDKVVGPADDPRQDGPVAWGRHHRGGVVESAGRGEGGRDLCHGAGDTHDSDHADQVPPGDACVPCVRKRVPQGRRDGGEKPQHREGHPEGGEERELSFELLLVAERQDDGLVVVDVVVDDDPFVLAGQDRRDLHVVDRENRGAGAHVLDVRRC